MKSLLLRSARLDLRQALSGWKKDVVFRFCAVALCSLSIASLLVSVAVSRTVSRAALPFTEPGALIRVWESSRQRNVSQSPVSVPNLLDWREQQAAFEGLEATELATLNLTGSGDPERIAAARVTPQLFALLGVQPALGRLFDRGDDVLGTERPVILGHGVWVRSFGANPAIVGTVIALNNSPYRVIGVMRPGFDFPGGRGAWVPLVFDPILEPWRRDRGNRSLSVFGRLRHGVTIDQAASNLRQIASALSAQHPELNGGWTVETQEFYDWLVPARSRTAATALLGAAVLLVALGCTNVVTFVLAHSAARRREYATRLFLGAGRGHVARASLIDGALFGTAVAALGLLCARWAIDTLARITVPGFTFLTRASLDGELTILALGVALVPTLVVGVVPLLVTLAGDESSAIRQSWRSGTAAGVTRVHTAVIAIQLALTVVVLTTAGVLLRSVVDLQRVDVGFSQHFTTLFQLSPSGGQYASPRQRVMFYESILERLRALPYVSGAGASSHAPLSQNEWFVKLDMVAGSEGASRNRSSALTVAAQAITPGYLSAAGIRLVLGRDLQNVGTEVFQHEVVVNESFARVAWDGREPLGRRFGSGVDTRPAVVVGVVRDSRTTLTEIARPTIYYPYSAIAMPGLTVAVRTDAAAASLPNDVRAIVRQADATLPVYNWRTIEDVLSLP